MKKVLEILLTAGILLAASGCGGQSGPSDVPAGPEPALERAEVSPISVFGPEEMDGSGEDSNILIAYLTMADIVPEGADAVTHATPMVGNTGSAALEIRRQTGGELFAIKTVEAYPVSHSECSAIAEEEMKSDVRPELTGHVKDMESYSTIYIGYPLWWYQEPMAVRTFLEEYDLSGKTIIPFCTSLGAGVGKSEENIRSLCSDATVLKGLTLRTGQDSFEEEIADWIAGLGVAEGRTPMTMTIEADENDGNKEAGMPVSTETESGEVSEVKVKITVGGTGLIATMEDNATTQAIIKQMPMTLPMMDLYGREMCYRYGAYALPTDELRSDGYEVGDLAYWAPGGSLVILYKQNGEEFERQHLGHIDSGVEVFESTGDVDVTFELVE